MNFDDFVKQNPNPATRPVVGRVGPKTAQAPRLLNTNELAQVLVASILLTANMSASLPEELQDRAVQAIMETTEEHISKFIRDHFDVEHVGGMDKPWRG